MASFSLWYVCHGMYNSKVVGFASRIARFFGAQGKKIIYLTYTIERGQNSKNESHLVIKVLNKCKCIDFYIKAWPANALRIFVVKIKKLHITVLLMFNLYTSISNTCSL